MDNLVNIGNKIDKESAEHVANSIATVFQSAFENHIDQVNITDALGALARTFEIKQVTITGAHFVGEDHTVTVNTKEVV